MFRFVSVFFVLIAVIGAQDLPRLLTSSDYTPADLATAANHFIKMGPEKAIHEMNRIAMDKKDGDGGFSRQERLLWICRLVFVPKENSGIGPPRLGSGAGPPKSMPLKHWPLYPLMRTGKSHFLIGELVIVDRAVESVRIYLQHCQEVGVFRSAPTLLLCLR